MVKNLAWLKNFLLRKKLLKNYKINPLAVGNNYYVFTACRQNKKYTIRVGKSTAPKINLTRQFVFLSYLQNKNINFAPAPLYFNKKYNLFICQFITGKNLVQKKINKKILYQLATKLATLHRLTYQDFKNFCLSNTLPVFQSEKPWENINIYGWKRFRYIKLHCPEKNFVKWIEPKLEKSSEEIKKIPLNKYSVILDHGDISRANILLYKNKMTFIDWANVRFLYSLDHKLTYLFEHAFFSPTEQKQFLDCYLNLLPFIKPTKLEMLIKKERAALRIRDVIWSTYMYTKSVINKSPDFKKYKKMTLSRIKNYEKNL